mgnify:CR=1 FL=1
MLEIYTYHIYEVDAWLNGEDHAMLDNPGRSQWLQSCLITSLHSLYNNNKTIVTHITHMRNAYNFNYIYVICAAF